MTQLIVRERTVIHPVTLIGLISDAWFKNAGCVYVTNGHAVKTSTDGGCTGDHIFGLPCRHGR